MNIVYNHPVTDSELELFKLIEEFVYTHLEDKSLFYRITLYLNESEDRNKCLFYIARIYTPEDYLKPRIKICKYAVRLYSNSFARCGDVPYNTYEKFRYHLIFHEVYHMVLNCNNPDAFKKLVSVGGGKYLNQIDEDKADQMADLYLKSKGIL